MKHSCLSNERLLLIKEICIQQQKGKVAWPERTYINIQVSFSGYVTCNLVKPIKHCLYTLCKPLGNTKDMHHISRISLGDE